LRLAEAAEAQRAPEGSATTGKVILDIGERSSLGATVREALVSDVRWAT